MSLTSSLRKDADPLPTLMMRRMEPQTKAAICCCCAMISKMGAWSRSDSSVEQSLSMWGERFAMSRSQASWASLSNCSQPSKLCLVWTKSCGRIRDRWSWAKRLFANYNQEQPVSHQSQGRTVVPTTKHPREDNPSAKVTCLECLLPAFAFDRSPGHDVFLSVVEKGRMVGMLCGHPGSTLVIISTSSPFAPWSQGQLRNSHQQSEDYA
jgi:hypothetical protein